MSDTGVGEMTRSAFSQAAASNNTNKEALGAQDGDSHASAASDTSAQLTARAILTIQRRAVNGRSGRPTPSKVDSLIRQAQDQAAASGRRLTTDYTLLEPLPIKHSADGGSDGGWRQRVGPLYRRSTTAGSPIQFQAEQEEAHRADQYRDDSRQ